MMSGLLPRIYPYDSVSCTYQNFYAIFQLSRCLVFPYLPFFAWLLFQGIFVYYCDLFLFHSFFHFLFILKKKDKKDRVSRIINCTAQIFAQAYKTRRIPGDPKVGTSVI